MDGEKKFDKNFSEIYDSLIESETNEQPSLAYLLDLFSEYNNDYHALAEIEKAYLFAKKLHEQSDHPYRESGEPYIVHPLAVAIILAKLHADKDTICAALLHDVIEDTGTTKENIGQLFNINVAKYVDGVSKLEYSEDGTHNKLDNLAYMRKLITESPEDLEIILIKLADKLHNMSTLQYKRMDKQDSTAIETLELFVPLAAGFGVYEIKNKLEDYSLKSLNPNCYHLIDYIVKEELEKRRNTVKETIRDISFCLKSLDIEPSFKCIVKNNYGIYKIIEEEVKKYPYIGYDALKKIISQHQIHDLISIQVIVADVKKCYEANQVISNYYNIKSEESKDFIKNPKTNMYRSLHTTIYDNSNNLLQIQIKTPDMDKLANCGVAALWDMSGPFAKSDMRKLIKRNIAKPVHSIDRIYDNNEEFMDHIKDEVLGDNKISVLTPDNESFEFQDGATVIDFAYRIHTDIGNHLDYAIVNGMKKDIYYKLHDGDRVEIFTSIYAQPNVLWLEHIATHKAYRKICEFVKIKEANQKVLIKTNKKIQL